MEHGLSNDELVRVCDVRDDDLPFAFIRGVRMRRVAMERDMRWNFLGSLTFVCLFYFCAHPIASRNVSVATQKGVSINRHNNFLPFAHTDTTREKSESKQIMIIPSNEKNEMYSSRFVLDAKIADGSYNLICCDGRSMCAVTGDVQQL